MVVSSDDEEEDAVNVQQAVTVKQDATAAPLGHAVKENTVDAGNTPVTEAENEASSIDADMPVEDNSTATVDAETSASSTAGKAKASPSKGTRSSPSKANFDAKAAPETDEETETAKQSLALFSSKEAAVLDDIEWQAGTPTPFSALAKTFEAIEGTTKRYV